MLIAHEREVIRSGIAACLRSHRHTTVIASTGEAEQVIRRAQAFHPDVALVSNRLLTPSGEPLLRALRNACPEIRLVAIIPRLSLPEVAEALRSGASGVVDEAVDSDVLQDVILAARSSRGLVTGPTAEVLLGRLELRASQRLTPRQRQVLEMLTGSLSTVEIARHLGIRPATVRLHVRHILKRLGAGSRAQAVGLAHRLGIDRVD